MWLNRTQAKGTKGDPGPSMDRTILRSCKGTEEMLGVVEQKFNAGIDVQSTNKKNQQQMCGDATLILEEEEAPRITSVVEEPPRPSLLEDKTQQSDVSSSSGKEGRDDNNQDIMYTVVSPNERDQVNTTSSTYLSSFSLQTRGNELPAISGATPEDSGDAGGGVSSPSRTRIVKNYVAQTSGKEAFLGNNAAEGKEDEDLHLPCCPTCKELEDERWPPSVENPDCNDISMPNSQEEYLGQRSYRNGDNDDYYDFIEEFLSEGALVNIDSAQTYVDLETGTVRTSVEVSAEDEGMEVKHEAEWVTQFVRSRKHN